MDRKNRIRGLVAFVLAAALFFHALPLPARAEASEYRRLHGPEALTSGQYVLVAGGYSPGRLEDGWLTALEPVFQGETLVDARGGVLTLEVTETGIRLYDSAGTALAPPSDGENGITAGDWLWQATWDAGLVSFRTEVGGISMTLAANIYANHRFRAYPDSIVEAQPEIYPGSFALYRLEPEEDAPEETTLPNETTLPIETTLPAETTVPEESTPETTAPPETQPEERVPEPPALPWKFYFGRLHSHSNYSDGKEPVQTLFDRAMAAGLDFYAVTDHSYSFDNDLSGAIGVDGTAISAQWAEGKAAAAAASGENFTALFGYEMSWSRTGQIGHMATFATPGWQSRDQDAYRDNPQALARYYEDLATVPGSVSVFCHPGEDTGNFEGFGHWSPETDRAVKLLEVGGEEGFDALDSYLLALNRGWHVGPAVTRHTSDAIGSARTVVLAKDLSEQALLDAVKHHRVYATMDEDLRVYFTLNGAVLGSSVPVSTRAELVLTLYDPTDSSARAEVLGPDGKTRAEGTVSDHTGTLTLNFPGQEAYYFLRVTQPDGDVAVTAPVWLVRATDMGIADFTANTQVPVRGKKLGLTLRLYNNEAVDFQAETAVFTIDGQVIHAVNLQTVPGGKTDSYTFSYAHPGLGVTEIVARVTGTVGGEMRTYEKTLTLRFRMEDTVGRILVDGSHGAALDYDRLTEIAAGENIDVTVARTVTEAELNSAQIFIIPGGAAALEPEFLALAAEFVKNGGQLILCGRSDREDGAIHWAAEGNKLMKALGLTLRLSDDTAADDIHNAGTPEKLAVTRFNPDAPWCAGLKQQQIYRQFGGCTVSGGTWLVRGFDTASAIDGDGDGIKGEDTVLLAAEDSRWGGTVFVSGGDFLSDAVLPQQVSFWEEESINQSILEKLLDIERVEFALSDISAARQSREGQVLRVKGYVTAGTSNSHNRFPGMIYLQDSTGGIAVTAFSDGGIQVGTPLEVIGVRTLEGGNPALRLMEYRIPEEKSYRFDPENLRHSEAMDYEINGGRLLQVEGTVKSLKRTADGKGLTRLTLKDAKGDLAEILIEDYIFSGSTGKNDLAVEIQKGRAVRARGILHLDDQGKPVLRVRNCDEVVYVPPNIIPKTGDDIGNALIAMLFSGGCLGMLRKKQKKPD